MCTVLLPTTGVMSAAERREENGVEDLEEEARGKKRKISLSHCTVCRSEEAKYRCPACLTHSCSLTCVKKHKEDFGCSGVRDKTAYVALSQFDEMTLLNDYRLLEDTGRFADGATRDRLVHGEHGSFRGKAKKLAAGARRKNITLRFLPVTFTQSKENSTCFITKEKRFLWHLKLIFPQSGTEFSQRRVPEEQTLTQILTPYIHPTESDPVTRQKLKVYARAAADDIRVFMRVDGRKANSVRFHELDVQKSLRDNLSYKTLIEYPVLHVVLREHWKDYPQRGPAERVSAPTDEAASTHGPGVCSETQKTRPEPEPPQQKRAKMERADEELEEGEIEDSGEEDEEGEDVKTEVSADVSGGTRSRDDMIENEPGEATDCNVDHDVNNQSSSGGVDAKIPAGDMHVIENAPGETSEMNVDRDADNRNSNGRSSGDETKIPAAVTNVGDSR